MYKPNTYAYAFVVRKKSMRFIYTLEGIVYGIKVYNKRQK